MGMPFEDIRQIAVPAEDGSLQGALGELDRKMRDYAAAVRQIAARLHAAPDDPAIDDGTPTTIEPAREDSSTPPPEQIRKQVAFRLTERRPNTAPASPPRDIDTHASSEVAGDQAAATVDASTAEETSEGQQVSLSPDETLLASLDEPTAKALRVLRRLNPHKTLQELHKQLLEHPPEPASKTAARAWFRFGR